MILGKYLIAVVALMVAAWLVGELLKQRKR